MAERLFSEHSIGKAGTWSPSFDISGICWLDKIIMTKENHLNHKLSKTSSKNTSG
jgi:hypothetical protein|tara:strand:+ start:87 stop:251 length:165 start_codon:yes stop_codon:yes gene_type:complete